MTRKLESSPATSLDNRKTGEGRAAGNLKSLRNQIDKLDLHILKLVNERAGVAAEIGKIKKDHGTEVFSPGREEEVLKNVLEAHKGPLDEQTVRAIFREIMSGSRALQKVRKGAY